jgi:hypothetical protein
MFPRQLADPAKEPGHPAHAALSGQPQHGRALTTVVGIAGVRRSRTPISRSKPARNHAPRRAVGVSG